MARRRTSMRKIKQVLRLSLLMGLSHREIARAVQMGRSSVGDCLGRAARAGLQEWTLVEALGEKDLSQQLYPPAPGGRSNRPLPDWPAVHEELTRDKHVTLALLWEEYREEHPEDGYSLSRFCELYSEWRKQLDVCLRHDHRAGERLFVDYCGRTVEIVDRTSGEVREAQIFLAVLGASNYAYAEATWSQQLHDWIGSHCRAFEFFGGATELIVPDNLKSAVTKACRYEPEVNPTYWEMAEHYATAILPARPRAPRDKAKVEAGVLLVERWILAVLRKRTFFSLAELNAEISRLLHRLNDRPLRVLKVSRRERFEALDRPALQPLPQERYEISEWKTAKPGIDYHVELDAHYYSVPYQLVTQQLRIRACAGTVEVFHQGKRVAAHPRSCLKGRHTTVAEHMPKAHQGYLEWTPQRLSRWAEKTGPSTRALVEQILANRPHPQQGYRSCLGIMRLGERYGADRLEAAAQRAVEIESPSYKSVKSILSSGLDRRRSPDPAPETSEVHHDNVRGPGYYR